MVGDERASSREQLAFLQNAVGAVAGPVRQLPRAARPEDAGAAHGAPLRERAGHRAAGWRGTRRCERVIYPGLPSHPQHALAKRQMHGFGGMVTVDARRRPRRHASASSSAASIFALAESLGGVESLIEHPAIMTHASLPPEVRAPLGIGDGLIRLSVGVEDVEDLLADLQAALGKAHFDRQRPLAPEGAAVQFYTVQSRVGSLSTKCRSI